MVDLGQGLTFPFFRQTRWDLHVNTGLPLLVPAGPLPLLHLLRHDRGSMAQAAENAVEQDLDCHFISFFLILHSEKKFLLK